jgi:hypothetical protein
VILRLANEGAVFVDRLPTEAEAVSIRKWCDSPKSGW